MSMVYNQYFQQQQLEQTFSLFYNTPYQQNIMQSQINTLGSDISSASAELQHCIKEGKNKITL